MALTRGKIARVPAMLASVSDFGDQIVLLTLYPAPLLRLSPMSCSTRCREARSMPRNVSKETAHSAVGMTKTCGTPRSVGRRRKRGRRARPSPLWLPGRAAAEQSAAHLCAAYVDALRHGTPVYPYL